MFDFMFKIKRIKRIAFVFARIEIDVTEIDPAAELQFIRHKRFLTFLKKTFNVEQR